MQICPVCGAANQSKARFCQQCAAPMPQNAARPSTDDTAWLAATLTSAAASHPADEQAVAAEHTVQAEAPAQAPTEQRGISMDQTPPQTEPPTLLAGRYERVAQQGDMVEVIDRQPWQRCWACGATSNEAGELYCIECGASLEGRHYHGTLSTGEQTGLALVPTVTDPAAREMLPAIWDQQRENESTLTLAVDTGRNPIAPPLEELDALHLGVGLARLLVALHREGFTLGEVTPADVEMTAAELPRLRNAANLARGTDVAEDLRGFASLMEAVTATPRTTQRLGEDEVAELTADPGIPGILRALRTGEIVDAAALLTQLENLLADRTQPLPLWANVGAFSNVGMVRDHNEDSLLTLDLRTDQNGIGRAWGLFIVADGMGGHSAGEVASGLAIRGASESVLRSYLTPTLEMDQGYDEQRLKDVVAKAIVQANEYVLREAQARGNDMGTTITMAVTVGDRAVIGNVGDSRTYLYRDGEMRRVSKDHSLVMRLVDLGQIGLDDIYTHPQRNAVLRSLGDKPGVEIDVFVERLKPGDALFLCSDGMWEMVRDPQMAKIIDANPDPQTACVELVKAANAAGGEDNIAAVLVKFEKYG